MHTGLVFLVFFALFGYTFGSQCTGGNSHKNISMIFEILAIQLVLSLL